MQSVVEMVREELVAAQVPGAAVALTVDGVTESASVGFRDMARCEPVARDARFSLYSVTKTLLAIAVLRLVDQGRAALDQPVSDLLPDLAPALPATLYQLLNHTAGVPDYGALPDYARDLRGDPGSPWSDETFLARTLRTGLLFPSGEGWAYSNAGYLLVRRAIERLTGTPLCESLDHLLFTPLGLRRTSVAVNLPDTDALCPGYSRDLDDDGQWHDISRRYHPGWVAHGLVVSTAADVATILDALSVGELLTPASLETMQRAVAVPGANPPFRCPQYGLGLMIDACSPFGPLAGHTGGGPGFATAAYHAPDAKGHRITVVILLNRDHPTLATDLAFAALAIAAA